MSSSRVVVLRVVVVVTVVVGVSGSTSRVVR
jgi:hypothetical protein